MQKFVIPVEVKQVEKDGWVEDLKLEEVLWTLVITLMVVVKVVHQ